jgi:hypothetical protein
VEIRKQDTDYLKGIAILLMFAHHLFAFPERILPPASYIPLIQGYHIEELFGSFGKICVAVFLFLSGYGFAINGKTSLKYYSEKVLRFFQIYWFYFALFIPIGFFFFPHVTFFYSTTPRFDHRPSLVILNALALTFSYNGEWWFVQPYLLLVISFPLTMKLAKKPVLLILASIAMFETATQMMRHGFDTPYISAVWLLLWQVPFMTGVLFALYRKQIGKAFIFSRGKTGMIPVAVSLVFIPVIWHFYAIPGLMAATPFFLYLCLVLRRIAGEREMVLSFLGSLSFPMWLTHSFFCYYYWQKIVYYPRFSILVFINLTILTAATCFIAEKARIRIFALSAKTYTAVKKHATLKK